MLSLERLETSIRRETASLFDALSRRQQTLSQREERHSKREAALLNRLDAMKDKLREGAQLEVVLRERRAEVDRLERSSRDIAERMDRAETRKREADRALEEAERRKGRLIEEVRRMEGTLGRLEVVEKRVVEREKEVRERLEKATETERRVGRYSELERVWEPLKHFLAEAAGMLGERRVRISGETVEGVVEEVLTVVRDMGRIAKEVKEGKVEVEKRLKDVLRKERDIGKKEAKLRARERGVEAGEQRVRAAGEDLKGVRKKVDAAWKGVEDARKEVDAKEELLRDKQTDVMRREERVRHAEIGLQQQERTLLRRERSVRRAHTAVAEREQVVERRLQQVEEERASLQNIKATIDLREDLLETRDLELTTREAKNIRDMRALETRLQTSTEGRDHDLPATPQDVAPISGLHGADANCNEAMLGGLNEGLDRPHPLPQASSSAVASASLRSGRQASPSATQPPVTVRRQLAFDTTGQREAPQSTSEEQPTFSARPGAPHASANPATSTNAHPAMDASGTQNHADDESEAAAEDLLPELVSARDLWRERILRLEAVVANMQENTQTVKPHIQPFLIGVATNLRGLRGEIESSPGESFESPKMSYAAEQRRQIEWGVKMRGQLDAVREVQAGMLIALNREEDALQIEGVGGGMVTAPVRAASSSGSETGVSPSDDEGESSADATLDATKAGAYWGDAESTEEGDTPMSSFQRFRHEIRELGREEESDVRDAAEPVEYSIAEGQQQTHQADPALLGLREIAPSAESPDLPPTVDESASHTSQGNKVSVLGELALLRNELNAITGRETGT